MAHEITKTDNLFSVRELPWHGLGEVLEAYPTREEAQKIAHNWEPVATPLYRAVPDFEDGEPVTRYEEVSTHVAQERSDTGDMLGVTTTTYTAVTNNEMWDVAEALQGTSGDVMFETGGSLRGGAQVWLMLRLQEPLVIKNDPNGATLPFYTLQNAHDGTGAFRGSATQIRAVCANTIKATDIDAQARGTEFTFTHSSGITERIEEARAALAGWREGLEAYKQLAELMIDEKVSKRGEREFIEQFIPAPVSTMTSEAVKRNIEEARNQWLACYNGVTCEGVTGTAWGLLQASSEWSEHIRRAQSQETRFRRAVLNNNAIITSAKVLALDVVGM